MSHNSDLADRATLSLIAADLKFFSDLALSPRLKPIRSTAALATMPFLSAFIVESSKYVSQKGLVSIQALTPHYELLRTSRQRFKLLDDDRSSFTEILDSASRLVDINNGWFQKANRGILGQLKRLIPNDLGVYFVHDGIVCTTHVAFLNMGLTEKTISLSSLSLETLGPYLRDTTYDFGRYMGLLLNTLDVRGQSPRDAKTLPNIPRIGYHDLQSSRFYESMAQRTAPQYPAVCILLTSILSQINTARVLAPIIGGQNEVALFKIQFVSLFHAVSNLQKLLNQHRRNNMLHPGALQRIETMLRDDAVRRIRKGTSLRNNLVHYRVDDERIVHRLSTSRPLFGLIEAHSSGDSAQSIPGDVQRGLDRISAGLNNLLLPEALTSSGIL